MTAHRPDDLAAVLRNRSIDPEGQRVLLSVLAGSQQEPDLSEPVVCDGLGRIRHFHQETSSGWPDNPLPIFPAARWLTYASPPPAMRSLVFQNAACNWRCWYCYVPFNLLGAHPSRSRWVTAGQLVDLYQALPFDQRPVIIDLSGGQPDLVPEWTLWMLDALDAAALTRQVYLWGDDNLSNDYLFRFLTDSQIGRIAAAPNYGRVCCLKGFDGASFSFNTAAPAHHFDRQFDLLRKIAGTGIDLYCYATFTTPVLPGKPSDVMRKLADRLQEIDENLPLRLVPLEIGMFGPVRARVRFPHVESMRLQQHMVAAWESVLAERFTGQARTTAINEVPLKSVRDRRQNT